MAHPVVYDSIVFLIENLSIFDKDMDKTLSLTFWATLYVKARAVGDL